MPFYYLYGMRLRGFSPGTFPKHGFNHRRDDHTGKYWDILAYTSLLTEEECRAYDLDFLGKEDNKAFYDAVLNS